MHLVSYVCGGEYYALELSLVRALCAPSCTRLRRYYSAEIIGPFLKRPALFSALYVFMGDPGAHLDSSWCAIPIIVTSFWPGAVLPLVARPAICHHHQRREARCHPDSHSVLWNDF